MKICGIICEFNPFHNGHEYLIKKAKELSGCDYTVCIMSGQFTQRGEICIDDKFTRAKHAVLGGADCVLELPTAFSVAPAEIFARGALKILSSVPQFDTLVFGSETGSSEDFTNAAKLLLHEDDTFKNFLNEKMSEGESYIKSYVYAFESIGGNKELLNKPNNVLGVEYAKAILKYNKNINVLPVKRIGAEYSDNELKVNFSSASAIRNNTTSPMVKNNLPDYVYKELKEYSKIKSKYEDYLRLILSRTDAEKLTGIYGCNEGLENALKNVQTLPYEEIIQKCTSKRYSASRIARILCANFLNIRQNDTEKFLNSKLYLFPLAVKKEKADEIFSALSKSPFPMVTSGSDVQKLNKTALKCKNCDDFAVMQWQQTTNLKIKNKFISI